MPIQERNLSASLQSLVRGGAKGSRWYVDAAAGTGGGGKSWATAYDTITKAVTAAAAGDTIYLAPGAYDEAKITVSKRLTIIGTGGRGAAYIEPSVEDQSGMDVTANDVTLINVGVAGEDETSAYALTVTGARFRAYQCKFEGGATQVIVGPDTVANGAASGVKTGADAIFDDCEFAWGTDGITLQGTDYGACTQTTLRDCQFHNLTGDHINDKSGTGATASILFRNFRAIRCVHDDSEGGAAPTLYYDLDTDNGNDGVVTQCVIPAALAGAKALVSTAVHWVGNYHTGGISTGQPS